MIANEVVHGVKKSKQHGFVMKVNLHKAFDSVAWEYLEEVISYMSFWEELDFFNPWMHYGI